jgi:serine/threonine-protein kinase RsbW
MHKQVFPAKLDYLYEMMDFIRVHGQAKNVDAQILDKVILAVEEALVNVISYSYPNPDQEGTIELIFEIFSKKPEMKIIIKDQGIPFNPVEQAPPFRSPEALLQNDNQKMGGYGIYIFVGIMDHVEYQRLDGGNVLTMTKYLS